MGAACRAGVLRGIGGGSHAGAIRPAGLRSVRNERPEQAFAGLPPRVVELGSGVGANLEHLPAGAHLTAIEPNPYMHERLRQAARRASVDLKIRSVVGERIDLPDASVQAVISSPVLCTVSDPAAVLAEIRRILRPGAGSASPSILPRNRAR